MYLFFSDSIYETQPTEGFLLYWRWHRPPSSTLEAISTSGVASELVEGQGEIFQKQNLNFRNFSTQNFYNAFIEFNQGVFGSLGNDGLVSSVIKFDTDQNNTDPTFVSHATEQRASTTTSFLRYILAIFVILKIFIFCRPETDSS